MGGIFEPGEFPRIGLATPAQDSHAPDLGVAAKEGLTFTNHAAGETVVIPPKSASTHGFLPENPGMPGIFFAWGAGTKPGTRLGRIVNTQVAPRMAKRLGLEMPLS